MALPVHVARDDEPIPAPSRDELDGPDLRAVTPFAEMIADLSAHAHDPDLYAAEFRDRAHEAGIHLSVMIDRDGDAHVMAGGACDAQMRHRSRWMHELFEHLDAVPGARARLHAQLRSAGLCADNRRTDPSVVTAAIRDFVRTGGWILITASGRLTEDGEMPRVLQDGTADQVAACARATRAYLDLKHQYRARAQIKRAAHLLGHATTNGWTVLEARA